MCIINSQRPRLHALTVADPGFPIGGKRRWMSTHKRFELKVLKCCLRGN